MIATLRGVYCGRWSEGIVVDVAGVGYEVLLPPIVEQELGPLADGTPVSLRIAYIATRDQPTPVLYGFASEEEKQFWTMLKSVARVGPKSAARAMVLPINRIAQAIQEENTRLVDSLPGVSADGAHKIVASLRKKMAPFAVLDEVGVLTRPTDDDQLKQEAVELLVQMGIKRPDAARDVTRLLKAQPDLRAVEDVVMEYFKK
jgi:Holliday junction DNA helicase RuvA